MMSVLRKAGRHQNQHWQSHAAELLGITDYLKSEGSLAEARKMAKHADTRTTQLCDRRGDTASLGEYEEVGI